MWNSTRLKPKVFIKTFGCQMNENDSEYILGQLLRIGYQKSEDIFQAKLIIVNSCCVRAKVEQKIFSFLGKLKEIKEKNPEIILGIGGCMVQKEKENIFRKAPYVDFIFDPSSVNNLIKIIQEIKPNKKISFFQEKAKEFHLNGIPIERKNNLSALIQIMRGCNNFCSYCIVPYTRGREQSRTVSDIIAEVKSLSKMNYKEIVLLGQNVNSYGKDSSETVDFPKLLSLLNKIEKIKRIRFITSHPKDFDYNLIQVIKENNKICEHIHLPIQSGSDKILRIMNREYDATKYKKIIKEIRNNIKEVSITTDVMVGFPGETEEDFRDTLNIFKELEFDSAFTFIYSNRENTVASLMPGQVPLLIKKKRLWKLIDLQEKISTKINKNLEGKVLEILVEKKSTKNISHQNQLSGRTRTNKTVVFVGQEELIGELVQVKIVKADTWTLYGELLK